MRNLVRASVLAAAVSVGAAPAASAVTLDTPTVYCLNVGALSSCATVTLTWDNSLQTLQVVLANSGGTATYQLAAFGFYVVPTNESLAGSFTQNGTWPTGWVSGGATPPNGLDNPLANDTWLGSAGASGDNRFGTGEGGTFLFNVGSFSDWDNLNFAFRGQEWNGNDSFKCYGGVGSTDSEPSNATCDAAANTSVPEPATMALLATGLVGLAGAGAIRRRRKQRHEDV